jgi:deoxycytidylate deaminase
MEVIRAVGLRTSYASAFSCIMCAGLIVFLGIPEVVAGSSWEGYEISRAFLESHGVKVKVLELKEAQALVNQNV